MPICLSVCHCAFAALCIWAQTPGLLIADDLPLFQCRELCHPNFAESPSNNLLEVCRRQSLQLKGIQSRDVFLQEVKMRRPGPATSAATLSTDSVACAGASLRTTTSGLHKRPTACSVRIAQVRWSQSRHPGSPLAACFQAERSRTLFACVRAKGGGIRSFNKEQRI